MSSLKALVNQLTDFTWNGIGTVFAQYSPSIGPVFVWYWPSIGTVLTQYWPIIGRAKTDVFYSLHSIGPALFLIQL